MKLRTSITHPLQIADVRAGEGMGRIGITFCPGKCQSDAMTGPWKRDLAADLQAISSWGAAAVVTLVEDHELHDLEVPHLGSAVRERQMSWFHLPIPDVTAPGPDFEEGWRSAGEGLRALLRDGHDVLVHCKGGLGRAGTISARLLVELGWRPEEAIAAVRRARPNALETGGQERHVLALAPMEEPQPDRSRLAVIDRALGALMGLAVGDALGTTLEFRRRDSSPPVIDLVGGGPFSLRSGEWTDDTAMALALADSLVHCDGLDEHDLMKRFVSWWRSGEYSCTGTCFDIGITTREALQRFERNGQPVAGRTDPNTAGNGSLMRLAPVVIYAVGRPDVNSSDLAARQSATTHGAQACLDACRLFAAMLFDAIKGAPRTHVIRTPVGEVHESLAPIAAGSYRGAHRDRIKSSGYVVHTLEAALWCVSRTTSFRDAVVLAANLADDADTVAAVTGQLAGAIHGLQGIPKEWIGRLAWADRIETLGRTLCAGSRKETEA